MFIRQIHYLLALAKTGHFGRAAEMCHVSQPALSTAIRHLEDELGITVINRGHHFQGFTEEGEKILHWARILARDWEGMRQAATEAGRYLSGELRLGVIPTMLAVTPLLTKPCQQRYPGMTIKINALSAEDLIRRLDNFEMDLGLTYLEDQRLKGFKTLPLYRERHILLAGRPDSKLMKGSLTWQDAAKLPLCLLTQNMQNRRLIDAAFREAESTPNVMLETDSVFALYAHVRNADLYSIVPHSMLIHFEMRREVTALPLVPELSRDVGLIMRRQEVPFPVQDAAWNIAQALNLQRRFDSLIAESY